MKRNPQFAPVTEMELVRSEQGILVTPEVEEIFSQISGYIEKQGDRFDEILFKVGPDSKDIGREKVDTRKLIKTYILSLGGETVFQQVSNYEGELARHCLGFAPDNEGNTRMIFWRTFLLDQTGGEAKPVFLYGVSDVHTFWEDHDEHPNRTAEIANANRFFAGLGSTATEESVTNSSPAASA